MGRCPDGPGRRGRDTMKEIERTAYHEAGHAVASYILRQPFLSVDVRPADDGSLGRVMYPDGPPIISKPWHPRFRGYIEKEVMSLLAGCEAESLALKRRTYEGGRTDYQDAANYAAHIFQPDDIPAFVARMTKQIRAELAPPHHWAAVSTLAEVLVAKKQLSGRAARRVIREAMKEYES